MSAQALAWADDKHLPPVLKLILIGLADSAGSGAADPAEGAFRVERLSQWCGLDRRELLEFVQDLEDLQILRVTTTADAQLGFVWFRLGMPEEPPRPIDPRHETRRRWDGLSPRARALIVDQLIARDGASCQHCGRIGDVTVDHVLAIHRGGSSEMSNLQLLCGPCNSRKGARVEP